MKVPDLCILEDTFNGADDVQGYFYFIRENGECYRTTVYTYTGTVVAVEDYIDGHWTPLRMEDQFKENYSGELCYKEILKLSATTDESKITTWRG